MAVSKYIATQEELLQYTQQCILVLINAIYEHKDNSNLAFIQRTNQYLEGAFLEDITLDSLANHLNLSTQYVSKLFKESYGKNFIDYITNKKIGYAKKLLINTDLSIKQVSQDIGYSDASYFSKIFRKTVGVTPQNFRRNN